MNYNKTMKKDRWTILEVDEALIKDVKQFSKNNGYKLGGGVEYLLKRGLKNAK